jgi:hypothetical protein
MSEKFRAFLREIEAAGNDDARRWRNLGGVCRRLSELTDAYPSWIEALADVRNPDEIRAVQKGIETMRDFLYAELSCLLLLAEIEIREREGESK